MIDAGLVGVGEFLPAALVDTLGGHAGEMEWKRVK